MVNPSTAQARVVVDELIRGGVRDVVLCPGSRNAPLATVISSMSSCGEETVVASNRISFKGGETKLLSVSYPIAPDTCPGQMTVSVSAYEGGVRLASGSTSLLIQ